MPTTEDGLQADVIKAVLKAYPKAWIFHPVGGMHQIPGIPDLLMSIEGHFIGIELKHKKPGESEAHARDRATKKQREHIQWIREAGGTADVALTVEETLDTIRRGLHGHAAAVREEDREDGRRWTSVDSDVPGREDGEARDAADAGRRADAPGEPRGDDPEQVEGREDRSGDPRAESGS